MDIKDNINLMISYKKTQVEFVNYTLLLLSAIAAIHTTDLSLQISFLPLILIVLSIIICFFSLFQITMFQIHIRSQIERIKGGDKYKFHEKYSYRTAFVFYVFLIVIAEVLLSIYILLV